MMLLRFLSTLATRSLISQKKFSLISILSLSLAFVSVLIISQWIQNELNYDRHFPKHDRIYRLTLQVKTPEGYESHFARVAQDWIQQIGPSIPEIENTVRFAPKRNTIVVFEDHHFSTQNAFQTDTTVFKVFDLEMLDGDESSLASPNCVILSESIAEKYFNDSSAVGKYIQLAGQNENELRSYLVTGVFKDFPAATHFHSELLISYDRPDQYGWAYFYLLLHKNTDLDGFKSKLDQYTQESNIPEDIQNLSLHIQALTDIHLYSVKDREIEINGNIQAVYIMGGIALMILLLALFNYINLNIAQLFKEIRFLVINKIYGASAWSIFLYQGLKSIFITLLSLGLSLGVYVFIRTFLERLFNIHLIQSPDQVNWFILICCLLFIISIVTGSIPAFIFILRRFKRQVTLRNTNLVRLFRPNKKFVLRKLLIGLQFFISLVLIITTIFAILQMRFITSTRMGISDDESILVIKDLSMPIRKGYYDFRDALIRNPVIVDVTGTMETPSSPIKDAFAIEADCPVETDGLIMYIGPMAENFFQFHDRAIVAGSDFPPYIQGQEYESYVLNESATKFLGWDDPAEAVGKSFKIDFPWEGFIFGGKIHGVVEDFHQATLHHKIDPTVYFQQPAFYLTFLIKVKTEDLHEAIEFAEATWNQSFPGHPFIFTYQRQLYDAAYVKENLQTQLSGIFAVMAIIITMVGLTGLTAILAGQRTREVGIRKVLGAGFGQLIFVLSKEILITLVIALLLAIPASIILTQQWLQNFAYAIILANWWWVPAGISIISLVLISLIVFGTVYQTARRNPVDSLGF